MIKVAMVCLLLSLLGLLTSAAKICKQYVCASKSSRPSSQINDTFCLNEQTTLKELYKVYVYSDMCPSTKYCAYYSIKSEDTQMDTIYSVCRNESTAILPAEISYPGEQCDSYGAMYSCTSGKKLCYFNRCVGNEQDSSCESSADCSPGLFCNASSGTCRGHKLAGESCVRNEECGRTSRCLYSSEGAATGVCTAYFSLANGKQFYSRGEYDHFLCASMVAENENTTVSAENQTYANYTFRVGMVTCGSSLTSIYKGKSCSAYSDCPAKMNGVTKSGRFAECGCFYDESATAACGPLNGDSEFLSYRSAFVAFLAKTKYCHVSRGFDYDCGAKAEFYRFKCAQAKAKNYFGYKAISCLQTISNAELYPMLYQAIQWCRLADNYS